MNRHEDNTTRAGALPWERVAELADRYEELVRIARALRLEVASQDERGMRVDYALGSATAEYLTLQRAAADLRELERTMRGAS